MKMITNRKIDALGRIVLPLEILTSLNLKEGDSLAVYLTGTQIVLLPNQNHCALCKNTEDLIEVNDRYICSKCREIIKMI